EVNGARLNGHRSAAGNIRFAGFDYIGSAQAAAPATQPERASIGPLPIINAPLIEVRNFSASVEDDAVTPPAKMALIVDDVAVKNVVLDPANPAATVKFAATAHSPGIAGNIQIDGTAQPSAAKKSLSLAVRADDISLSAIKPYLDSFAITSSLDHAAFACNLLADVVPANNALTANGVLTDLKLTQDGDLAAMDHVSIRDAKFAAGAISIGDMSIGGPTLVVSRRADGSVEAGGFRFDPHQYHPRSKSAALTASPTTKSSALPSISIAHFLWNGVDVSYDDQALSPPLNTHIADAGVELKQLSLGVPSTQPGWIRLWAKIPKIVESALVRGDVTPAGEVLQCNLTLSAAGIDSSILRPFFQPFNIEPTLHHGTARATIDASVHPHDGQIDGRLKMSDITYREGDEELAGVNALTLDRFTVSPNRATLGELAIDHPRATITRQPDGSIAAAGVRLASTFFHSRNPATTSPTTQAAPFDVLLSHVHIGDGSLRVIDQAAPRTPLNTTATATLDLQNVAPGQPVTLSLHSAVAGIIDASNVSGTIKLNPESPAAKLAIDADGIRAGSLAQYLPDGLNVTLRDGHFHANIEAAVSAAPTGGEAGHLVIDHLKFTDGNQPLAKLDSARIIASRIDPAANVFALDELSTDGAELGAKHTASGGIAALGIDLETPKKMAATAPAIEPASTHPAQSVADILAQSRKPRPEIHVDRLTLNIRRLMISDDQRPTAAPLNITDLRFRNLDHINWGGHDAEARVPTHLRMDCTLDPAIASITVTALTSPLVSQPTLSVDVLASGIRGDGLLALVPELKPMLVGDGLVDGQFHLHADASARFGRHGTQIEYTGPLDAEIDVKPIEFRAIGSGPVIAGVGELHSDSIHLDPRSGAVHIKTIEITKPTGRISRENDGIHALGMVVKLPTPTTAPAPVNTPLAASVPSTRPTKPRAEIRVDQLVVNDLDFQADDRTVNPPLIVPLNGLDVEVRDFTNFAPYEDRPLKFSAMVNAGKVRLPKAHQIGVSDAERQFEDRELFAQASANGSIGLYPTPNGFLKASVGGFELASLESTAAKLNETLRAGVFDGSIDAKLPGDNTIQTKVKAVFTDLSLSEPPNGLLFRVLHLPAPLDVVIGALQDPDGSITVPLEFPVKNESLSKEALVGPAVGAFGSIVATAIASAPIKVANTFADIAGLGGNKNVVAEMPILLNFDAGDIALSDDDRRALSAIKTRLIKDQSLTVVIEHALGGGDMQQAEMRSNPSPQEARYLADQMRQQQLASAELRSNLEGVARSAIERGMQSSAEETLTRLRQVDQQMAQTDDAMDRLYEMLRPGADRLASRRTRSACLQYGKERLAEIQSALLDQAPAELGDRIHLLTPRFSQPSDSAGGTVIIHLIPKKKS
ncbi:MAG: DUF748 domain-containing protein, partial [Phycisphaerae bacterium]|nr:DUF748 domain-containing protein [Phycisphaerae bacterium]